MFCGKMRTLTLLATTILLLMVGVWSCDTEPSTAPPVNKPPVVSIVNIPPDSSHFTSNPVIYWYGTDVDGYIVAYEYLVVRADTLSNHNVSVTDRTGLITYAMQDFNEWSVVFVDQTEGNPTRQKIRLFASQDPADSVSQVFFVRSVDDDSARSNIDYRVYSRNNHPPDTEIKLSSDAKFFWDLPDTTAKYKGIEITWEGSDTLDYGPGSAAPSFEFYFQLFGPFESLDTVDLAETFDTTQTDKLVFTAVDTSTNSVWLKTDRIKVWDLWRRVDAGVPAAETREAWFVAKVTSRDDAFVSDPTPAFIAFRAIYPRFENHLAISVVPDCANSGQVGEILCKGIQGTEVDIVKLYKEYVLDIFAEAGYPTPDTLPNSVPDKSVVARYRNIVFINDGESGLEITAAHLDRMAEFMDLGGNVWIWAPSPFKAILNSAEAELRRFTATTGRVPLVYFDVLGQWNDGWKPSFLKWWYEDGMHNDQFMRGLAIYGKGFSDFDIDTTKAWIYFTAGRALDWRGAPFTSYFVRDVFSEPLFLIDSYYGDFVPDELRGRLVTLQGKVVGLRYDAKTFKSAVFGWSIWMMYKEDAVTIVSKMMDWFED